MEEVKHSHKVIKAGRPAMREAYDRPFSWVQRIVFVFVYGRRVKGSYTITAR